jgi:uncharacterized membrane protein YhaH (DUF805 family)
VTTTVGDEGYPTMADGQEPSRASTPELQQGGSVPGPVRLAVPSVRRVATVVAAVVAILVVLGAAAAVARARDLAFPGAKGLLALFHLDSEFNVPAIVSVLGLAACGVLLMIVGACLAQRALPDATRWRWLGVGFLYLALDEGARVHERANAVVNELGISLPALRFGWVLVGIVAVFALIPVYLPAVLRLPKDLRRLAILSAVLFVGGALGMEMVGASLYERGTDDALYQTAVLVEETGEIVGVGLFFVTLWWWWGRVAPETHLAHDASAIPGKVVR